MYFTLKPKEGTSTSSKEPEQQQVLTANTKSDKPPGLTPQVKDSKQYETSSQDRAKREIKQLESRIVSFTLLKYSDFTTPENNKELED